jgi:iron complex outermembrane receptor protein
MSPPTCSHHDFCYGNITLTAYITNVTDEAIAATYQLGAGSVSSSAYEPPRTYGLRLGYSF